jgi:hypothetical protein
MKKELICYIGTLFFTLIVLFNSMMMITTGKTLDVVIGITCMCLNFFYATQWIKFIYQEMFNT